VKGKKILVSVILTLFSFLIVSCISVARIDELPKSVDELNFGSVEKTEIGYYEHIFVLDDVDDSHFYASVEKALTSNRFEMVNVDKKSRALTAKRGLGFNEWESVVGVYSKREGSRLSIKVIVKITQDFTGTMPQSYAENIAIRIQKSL
jgi:hypothetical protein